MIEKKFKDMILSNPKIKVSTLQEMRQSELGAYATYNMCQRVRKNVLKEKNGSYLEEFATAVKQGWIEGCRPFIGVDGCFLKAVIKGALLVAVGRDANN
ncbi:hypothetical protein V6N13_131760 [Hibiscus sabdariffa]